MASCANVPKYTLRSANAATQICDVSPIPDPWIVTTISTGTGCGTGANRYTIALVGDLKKACNLVSPIPDPYVVIRHLTTTSCKGAVHLELKQVSNGILACYGSPIPAEYVINEMPPSAVCSGARFAKLSIPTPGMIVCPLSPIPVGWAVTGTAPGSSSCPMQGLRRVINPI